MEFVIMGLMFVLGGLIVGVITLIYHLNQTNKELALLDLEIDDVIILIDEQEKEMAANLVKMDELKELIKGNCL